MRSATDCLGHRRGGESTAPEGAVPHIGGRRDDGVDRRVPHTAGRHPRFGRNAGRPRTRRRSWQRRLQIEQDREPTRCPPRSAACWPPRMGHPQNPWVTRTDLCRPRPGPRDRGTAEPRVRRLPLPSLPKEQRSRGQGPLAERVRVLANQPKEPQSPPPWRHSHMAGRRPHSETEPERQPGPPDLLSTARNDTGRTGMPIRPGNW